MKMTKPDFDAKKQPKKLKKNAKILSKIYVNLPKNTRAKTI